MKRIIVDIDPQGNTKVKTEGYQGTSCKEATEVLEKALGSVVSDKDTDELYADTDKNLITENLL